MIKTILFPTDFSENANQALKYALKIAKDFDAKIHIINTYQIPYSTAAPATHQLLNALKIDASEELSKYINTIKSDSNYKNLTITHEAISGDLINVVSEIEREDTIDLIVLGTKGASGIKELLIGSNAEQVVYHSKSSVLVIPEEATSNTFNEITLATDFKPVANQSTFDLFAFFCTKYNSKVKVLNVKTNSSSIKSNEEENFANIFSDLNISLHTIQNDDITVGINDFLEQNKSNLLALVSRKYSFFENIFHKSISKKLTCHTKIPIFVIKEK